MAKVSVPVEIGTMELPEDEPVIADVMVGLFRQCPDLPRAELHAEQFRLGYWDSAGEYRAGFGSRTREGMILGSGLP